MKQQMSKSQKIEEAQEVQGAEFQEEESVPLNQDKNIKGDLLEEHEKDDYRNIQHLDQYQSRDFDEAEYENMSLGAKRRAEEEIKKREGRKTGFRRNVPNMLLKTEDDSHFSQGNLSSDIHKRTNNYYDQLMDIYEEEDQMIEERFTRLDAIRGKLPQWIKESKTLKFIKRSFKIFLTNFQDQRGKLIYVNQIHNMCKQNKQSIQVDYQHLSDKYPTIAYWVFETPSLIFGLLNSVVLDIACKFYPGYESIQEEVFVKISNFPLEEKIRDLRTYHLHTLIKVKGVVTRKFPVYQKLKKLYYICVKCTDRKGPIYQNDNADIKLGQCPNCHSNGPYKVSEEDRVYGNHQKIVVQESPQSVPPGRVPRSKTVILLGDNIDVARPGDEVEIVGIYSSRFDYSMNAKHGAPIFSTYIECNHIKETRQIEATQITDEDVEQIQKFSRDPKIFQYIYSAIAPSIYGHNNIKKSITLALFGGVPINKESHVIRGDINILLLGDPGLGKSQFLKYVQNVSHRSVYTTGKGASAVGLTASVKRDPMTQEWCLEGGALVLADTGICLIDEFDKMNDSDRTSIHEAMEQQSISISKAGIVATLKARCSIIAAANPFKGTYDDKLSFKDNVELSDPILSRFDILCVLKDEFNVCKDERLADFIINSHIKNHPQQLEEEMETENTGDSSGFSQDFLKKYILYAKKYYNAPKLDQRSAQKLENFYVQLRKSSKKSSGLNIVVRHLESLMRMTQASAKIHLRKITTEKDCNIAIDILLNSFISSQKPSVAQHIKSQFQDYLLKSHSISSKVSFMLNQLINRQLMYDQFQNGNLEEIKEVKVRLDDLKHEMKNQRIHNIDPFLNSRYFSQNFKIEKRDFKGKKYEYIVKVMQLQLSQ